VELHRLVRVARMYYELGMNQEAIARVEGVSRSTVSRMLDTARREGIVQVRVSYPLESVESLEAELMARFPLRKAFVTRVAIPDRRAVLQDVCRSAAAYILQVVASGQKLGVSWGNTMYALVVNLHAVASSGSPGSLARDVTVVQLNGGVARSQFSTQAGAIVESFAAVFHGTPYLLPVPAIVDSEAAPALMQESSIRMALELARSVDVAVFGIGYPSRQSILFQAGYYDTDKLEALRAAGAVGDILSRYFDSHGRICDPDLDRRTIGLTLEELRSIPTAIAVAVGEEKAAGILGALRGSYCNVLFTDEQTARAVLALHARAETRARASG